MAIVLEVQRAIDPRKRARWPSYVADVHAKLGLRELPRDVRDEGRGGALGGELAVLSVLAHGAEGDRADD